MYLTDLSGLILLDGNGDPFDETRRYFNRYQSTLEHDLRIKEVFVKHIKTVGGFPCDRPAVRCEFIYPNYAGGKTRKHIGHFEADFIEKGVYGFPQMIPIDKGITLDFEYGNSNSYANAVQKKRQEASNEKAKEL